MSIASLSTTVPLCQYSRSIAKSQKPHLSAAGEELIVLEILGEIQSQIRICPLRELG